MFYALNKDGIRIDAYEADKNEQYTCPICNNRVILKRGSVNINHFAHEANVCEDTWNYDIVLQELIDKIEVFPIEGTGKNRTQRLVIHYRFVGCIDLPSIVPKHTYKLDSRQGVAIEYLSSAV